MFILKDKNKKEKPNKEVFKMFIPKDKNKKEKPNMDRRTFIKMSSGVIVAVSANWFPRVSLAAEDEIRIGGVAEISGPGSTTGEDQRRGMELAVEMYNNAGGILGKKIKLFMEDTETKKDIGLAKARRLVERNNVHFLTGITFSPVSMAIQSYVREKRILFVNSGSGNDDLIKPPFCDRYFFKNFLAMAIHCAGIQEIAKGLGPRWYFIADDFRWGKVCIENYKKAIQLVRPDFKVVGEDYPPFGEINYAPYITKIMAANPDGLALATYGTGWSRVVKHARQMNLKCHIHHSYWSLSDIRATGDAIFGVTTSSDFLNESPHTPRAKMFSEKFKEKFGEYPGLHGATGFNGVEVIMEAVKVAGTIDTETVIDTMESMVYQNSVQGPNFHFRKSDHNPISNINVFEIVKDPKYTYGAKILWYGLPLFLLPPDDKTGCDEVMKKKA